MQYFLTVTVPVEAENPADANDLGWEKLLDPDGPPEGLIETVTLAAPVITGGVS